MINENIWSDYGRRWRNTFLAVIKTGRAKAALNLSGKDLMINETIDRVATVCDKSDIFIVTNVRRLRKWKLLQMDV